MTLTLTPETVTTTSVRLVRRTGWAVAAGAALWAGTFAVLNPQTTDPTEIMLVDLGQLPAQLALFALVTV